MTKTQRRIIGILAIILIFVYVFFFFKNQQRLHEQHFLEAKQEIIKQQQYNAQKKFPKGYDMIEKQENILIVPSSSNQDIQEQIENQLLKYSQEIPNQKHKQISFITVNPISLQKNIYTYQFVKMNYIWDDKKEKWKESTEELETMHQTFSQLTDAELTLSELFNEEPSHFLYMMNQLRASILEEQHLEPSQAPEVYQVTQTISPESTNFSFTEDYLTLFLPENTLNLSEYQLPIDKIGNVLNPEYTQNTFPIVNNTQQSVDNKYVALTFDDGPNPQTTPEVLNILKSKNIPATFYLLGSRVEQSPEIVQQIVEDGHELGNHSYNHPNLVTLSPEEVYDQVNKTQWLIYQATGHVPKSVRPPYGSVDYRVAYDIGLPIAQWSIDSHDWSSKDPKKIEQTVVSNTFSGGIILLHDIHPETVKALPGIIDQLKAQGYQFVTFSELMNEDPLLPLEAYYSANDQKPI